MVFRGWYLGGGIQGVVFREWYSGGGIYLYRRGTRFD